VACVAGPQLLVANSLECRLCDSATIQICRSGTVRGSHTGQVEKALWGHVDIMQTSVLDPAGRTRAGLGDGS
jgi:hypothetical protein